MSSDKKRRKRPQAARVRKLREKPIVDYGDWQLRPELIPLQLDQPAPGHPEMTAMETLHEGTITYLRLWNFWVRVGTPADAATEYFFHDYETGAVEVSDLISDVGTSTAWPRTEEEVWARVSTVWDWLGANVRIDDAGYGALVAAVRRWPSIAELARYYRDNRDLVWSACFSKAHLFANLLGRVLPRWRTAIASAHHTEGGAPATASHVYLAVYLTGRWYYLDPTAVYAGPLPDFPSRRSVGLFATVDYEHPFAALPVPLSPLDAVPHLPS